MTALAVQSPTGARQTPPGARESLPRTARVRNITRIQRALMWIIGASGGIVVIEPAPYEFAVLLAMVVFVATGLTVSRAHLPLIFFLIAYNAGYLIGVLPVSSLEDTVQWTAVSCFMSVTTLFFALALTDDTERRLALLLNGYLVIAVLVSVFGIVTYFRLIPGSDPFIFASRSRATFKDPNVLGAFLVLPGLLAIQKTMTGRLRDFLIGGAMTAVLVIELLLAFSRGAWGAFGAAVVLMLGLTYLTSGSGRERRRIILIAGLGGLALGALLVVILSLPQVADLFQERAALTQDYDTGRFGRFGRHILGAALALDHPWGIGPLQFSKYFPEDPHNSFLEFVHGRRLAQRRRLHRAGPDHPLHRAPPGVRAHALAPGLHRPLRHLRGRDRRELHHRRPALAPLFPDHGGAVGPVRGRRGLPPGSADRACRDGAVRPLPGLTARWCRAAGTSRTTATQSVASPSLSHYSPRPFGA